ncbi:hypothetical protein BGZ67_005849 [Mortierella alpina]|nr:hypothetical protein BGZ67_005849 [Mortierella alpina]
MTSMKRARSSPDPQQNPGGLPEYSSDSLLDNVPQQDLDLDLDLDRGFLGMNLESPLKKKRTDTDLVLEPDLTYACGGPGICSKDFCFRCL